MQLDRDTKPWAGQLYITHTSEASCKLLYKKFFRKTDTTILHGPWKTMLLEQLKTYSRSRSNINLPSPAFGLSKSQSVDFDKAESPSSTPPIPSILSPSNPTPVQRSPSTSSNALTLSLLSSPGASPSPPVLHQSPSEGSFGSPGFNTTRRSRATLYGNPDSRANMQLISSSRHGIVSPAELEPFQCFVLFYTSSWAVPQTKNRRLTRVFGPALVPKIEAYIRDEYNGEQCPGTSFILETGSLPCKYIVCTSVARNINCLSTDYAYNAFRSALLSIYSFNRNNPNAPITSILCPAMESITLPPYNLIHQMSTCYEYWDWHIHAKGGVLPFTHEDEEDVNKQIKTTSPSLVRIAQDLDQYIRVGLLASRGLVYDSELQIILDWLTSKAGKTEPRRERKKSSVQVTTDLSKHVIAQVLVDVLKRPDIPPFTLTPSQICSGITGAALESILGLAKDRKIEIYDEIRPEDLKIGEMIAQGTSGKVSVADWGGKEVAVKVFVELQPELFMQELTMITLVRHPKLVEAVGGYYDQHNAYIVTELLDMNLLQVLQNKTMNLQFNAKMKIAIDIAEAMEFLHSRNVVHRDLKSVNVLLNRYTMVAKVCDFGLSRVIDCTSTLTGNIGTVGWIAPEIFQNKQYTEKCDVYSYGIILFELIAQVLPFKDVPSFKIPPMVVKGLRPTLAPEAAAVTPKDYLDLMKLCWHSNPQKRPTFTVILSKLQSFVSDDVTATTDPQSTRDEEDEISYCSSSDEDGETSSATSTGNVLEQEQAALEELKPMVKRIRHPLVSEELLLKCVRARHCKPVAAKHLLLRYIEWYQLLTSGKPIKITDVRKPLESQVLYYVEGACDNQGRNIIFWDMSNYDVDVTPEPVLMRTFVYCLERATERSEAQTKGIILLANLTDWSMARFSTRIVNSFFGTVRKYFPVIVHRILFLNAPGWFFKVLTMYQSFISSTMDLIELVTPQKLLEYINIDNLVPAVQGNFHFDMELWVRNRYSVEGVDYQ